jgi:ABC-type dipeptide/oligopeptide/nickel transport system permease subunit
MRSSPPSPDPPRPSAGPPRASRASSAPNAPSASNAPAARTTTLASKRPPPSVVQRIAERAELVRGTTVVALRDPAKLAVSAWWSAVQRDLRARVGTAVLVAFVLLTAIGALVPPLTGHADASLRAPSFAHPFGTDEAGRDLLGALLRGAVPTVAGGAAAALGASALGVALGALAGYLRGAADASAHRLIETAQALPSLLVVLVIEALVPSAGFGTLVLAVVIARSAEIAAAVRADVLRALALDHVLAARALGAGPGRVFAYHVLPHAVSAASALAPFVFGAAVALETAVQALGVGRVHPLAWGALMGGVRAHPSAWWLVAFPALAAALVTFAGALLGDAMRDAADPRLRGRAERA